MQVQPHLFFDGRCEEAIEFYRNTLGAEVTMLVRFKDMPEPHPPGAIPPGAIPPGAENKVMHASLRIGDTAVLVSDGRWNSPAHSKGLPLRAALLFTHHSCVNERLKSVSSSHKV